METYNTLAREGGTKFAAWLAHPLTRFAERIGFEAEALSYFIEQINPLWSLTTLKARVEQVIDENHDVKTFVLRPNWHWGGIKAGQHIGVTVEVNGVKHKRRYSLSKAESIDKLRADIQITVKRVPEGVVSNYFHRQIRVGDVIDLGAAEGDFVLPPKLPSRILVLAAGSGITPVFSQVASLLASGYQGQVDFMHYVRVPKDCIFDQSLRELAEQHKNLRVHQCYTKIGGQKESGRFSVEHVKKHVADYQDRYTLLCGPAGFMAAVRQQWKKLGRSDHLLFEYFGTPPVDAKDAIDAEITLKTGKRVKLFAGETLLDSLLNNGENPKFGCKRGVCHECTCLKTKGAVKNTLTGKVSGSGEEHIQLCISVPVSNLTLS